MSIMAQKIGMSSFMKDGKVVPVTLLKLYECCVVDVKEKVSKVLVGYDQVKKKALIKAQQGLFSSDKIEARGSKNIDYYRHVREFNVKDAQAYARGDMLSWEEFTEGTLVDVQGYTWGKGFSGVMKRHGFKGGPASHGASKFHRGMGSTGQCQDPGRVFKGKKMPGQDGGHKRTVKNLRIVHIDQGEGVLFLLGSIHGKPGSDLRVQLAQTKKIKGGNHA